jgi:hypothetical protein
MFFSIIKNVVFQLETMFSIFITIKKLHIILAKYRMLACTSYGSTMYVRQCCQCSVTRQRHTPVLEGDSMQRRTPALY